MKRRLLLFCSFSVFLFFNLTITAQHFTPVWSGNPYQPMNIIVSNATLNTLSLDTGDEIAVFDIETSSGNEICVGVVGIDTSYNVKIARKTSPLSADAAQATKFINGMFLLDEILDFKPAAELAQLVSNVTGKRATTVTNDEEVPLLEADTTVEETPAVEESVDDSDTKKQKLLDELNKIV